MKLIAVYRCHFGRSEHSNFESIKKHLRLSPKADQVVCLVSHGGNQMIFVYGYSKSAGSPVVLRSERLRLIGRGTWNPMMLANYAKQVGLHLDGIKLFEEYYRR